MRFLRDHAVHFMSERQARMVFLKIEFRDVLLGPRTSGPTENWEEMLGTSF